MSNAPFEEKLVVDYANNAEASAAYTRLQTVLKEIAPEKGIQDDGDGSGSENCFTEFDKGEPITTTVHVHRRRGDSEDN